MMMKVMVMMVASPGPRLTLKERQSDWSRRVGAPGTEMTGLLVRSAEN